MHQIIYFIAVVKNKNFTKAAAECHISQPAISQQIHELEDSLGLKLLLRHGRTFTLTPAGQYFYQHSQDLIANYRHLIAQTQKIAHQDRQAYTLRLGYLRDFGTQEFLQAVTIFSKRYPQVKVKIRSGNHEDLFAAIEADQIDLNFSDLRRAPSNKYVNDHLINSPFQVLIRQDKLPSKREKVDSHLLTAFPCILVVGNSEKESEIKYYRHILGIESEFNIVGTYEEALVQVRAGLGYLITNQRTARQINDHHLKKLNLLNGQEPMMQEYYAFWKANNLGYYIETFAKILEEQFK